MFNYDRLNNNDDEVQHLQLQQTNDNFMRNNYQAPQPQNPLVGVTEGSISQVMEMAGCERNQAIRALFMNNDNVLNAVMQQRGQNNNGPRHAAEM